MHRAFISPPNQQKVFVSVPHLPDMAFIFDTDDKIHHVARIPNGKQCCRHFRCVSLLDLVHNTLRISLYFSPLVLLPARFRMFYLYTKRDWKWTVTFLAFLAVYEKPGTNIRLISNLYLIKRTRAADYCQNAAE